VAKPLRIVTVVGARPQFIKAAAVGRAIAGHNETHPESRLEERIVHTGQHYDENMSKVFFDELRIPRPAVNLGVGSGTHGGQTGAMLDKLEQVLLSASPDWVLIYGDTNSTLAGALAAVKLHVPVAHVEAGLRSFNRRMPEEINRIVADRVATLLFCPTKTAVSNLKREGIVEGVHQTGDVMYDSVLFNAQLVESSSEAVSRLKLAPKSFYLATIHRAENTDDPKRLAGIVEAFSKLERPIVLPLHPRTRRALGEKQNRLGKSVRVIDPAPYLDMLTLERSARLILTDSGGVQKEAYWFGVPCVTLREETEWAELVQAGCNSPAGVETEKILEAVRAFEENDSILPRNRPMDLYGDGNAAKKIVECVASTAI
jgi:UDP-N-acetylglucosamine 2-epimerase